MFYNFLKNPKKTIGAFFEFIFSLILNNKTIKKKSAHF